MAGLHAPLSTLRPAPRGATRMTRGQYGLLDLYWRRLSLLTPCRSPGALHNHPTGDPTPSQEDIAMTRRLKESGEILGIKVLDHIIIGDGEFLSFVERGLL